MKLFLTTLVFISLTFCLKAQTGTEVQIQKNTKSVSLDGLWYFIPAAANFKPVDASPNAVDEKAKQLRALKPNWFSIKTPQFLNRISWWLPNVSLEYEQQETDRVNAFPFDATKTQSGWYLKTIDLPKNFSPKHTEIYADFEGVATISRVYCNGNYVGEHLGMFGAFNCRLTAFLKSGKNQLLVYVERGVVAEKGNEVVSVAVTVPVTRDMLASLNSGLFGGFGNGPRAKFMGIWQPVTLKVSNHGGKIKDVFFNPSLTGHHLKIEIKNPEKGKETGEIYYTIKSNRTNKILVKETSKTLTLNGGGEKTIQIEKTDLSPVLWTPDHPYLYDLIVQWKNKKGYVIDEYQCEIGYRTVATRGNEILLNGKPYWLRGADMPPYGYKPNDERTARAFLQLMHDGNTVITRTHGNPWNDMWYKATDEIGIGVSSEGVRPWALMTTAPPPATAILAHWKQEQLESIKKYRNHPSILFYELSNEGLQGDHENPEKLDIFKDLIDAVRKEDPSRPIFQTSGDPDVRHQADIEDVHSYWGWYESSSFINDYTKSHRGLTLGDGRPFVNEECAVPYSMIDNGAVHSAYVGRYSAQSWVGDIGVYGKNTDFYQQHIYLEGKMKAEKLRYSRKVIPTAGFLLFSNVTWIQHALSRPPEEWNPFPVYEGVKEGFQPILVAMESPQRNFFERDTLRTKIYLVNDDTQFKDLKNTALTIQLINSEDEIIKEQKIKTGDVNYYGVKSNLISIIFPKARKAEEAYTLIFKLFEENGKQVSLNKYEIKLYKQQEKLAKKSLNILSLGNTPAVNTDLQSLGNLNTSFKKQKADVIILGPTATEIAKAVILQYLKKGGRLIVLQQQQAAHRFCLDVLVPDHGDIGEKSKDNDSYMYSNSKIFKNSLERSKGEFVEMLGWDKHPAIFKGLKAMDWKWWAMKDSTAAYVSMASHKIAINNPNVIPLGRYLNSHFYWQGDLKKIYEGTISYPVFAVNENYGKLVVCELNITQSIGTDPRAAITLNNLITAPITN